MGIESGPSGAISVAGPAVSIGPGAGAPSLGVMESFGPKFESVSYQAIDSPIGKGELQNMVPYKVGMFEPKGSISFSSVTEEKPSYTSEVEPQFSEAQTGVGPEAIIAEPIAEPVLSEPGILTEAKHWLGIVEPNFAADTRLSAPEPLSEAPIIEEAKYWLGLVSPKPETFKNPTAVGNLKQPATSNQPEATSSPVALQQIVEEIVREPIVKQEKRKDDDPQIRQEEEIEESKIKYVEHEAVARRRISQLRQAVDKADAESKTEGIEEIPGDMLKNYFAPEDQSNRAGIAEPGFPDPSLAETYQVLAARDYGSAREAYQVVETTVEEIKPVKKAKEGKKVKERDIARILRDPFLKSHPVEEVLARVVKKTTLAESSGQTVVRHEFKPEALEGTIEELDLTEVFGKT